MPSAIVRELPELIPDLERPTVEQTESLLTDKFFRLNNLYHIRNKEGQIVRFRMNPEQIHAFFNRHFRDIQLKVRQIGFTTLEVIDSLDDCLFIANTEAGIIAHSLDDAKKIFEKAKLAFEFLPSWIKKRRIPETDTTDTYKFPNNSKFMVDTGYRGGTLSRLHVSELAAIAAKFPERAREIKTGAFEAVPITGRVSVESTAKGMTGLFYELCDEAMPKDPEKLAPLEFKFHFSTWWKHHEYQYEGEVEISAELVKYFAYLLEDHEITLTQPQKNWYALKKSSLKGDMHQEYPSYPEEAFLASGRPVFNQQEVAADIKRVRDEKHELKSFVIKDMEENEHVVQVKIFKEPAKGMSYATAGDPAEGLETGDNSALSVLSKDFSQVAAYAGKLDTDLFGALLVEVAKYFNNSVLAWEQNNHGHAVENAVKLRKYYHLYRRKTKEKIAEEMKEQVGWLNTVKSKMEMLDELKESYRDGSLEVNDVETLHEMLKCVLEEDGNIIVNGKDRVVCMGISIQAIKQARVDGENKAFSPNKAAKKDVTKMEVEEKIRFYNKKRLR